MKKLFLAIFLVIATLLLTACGDMKPALDNTSFKTTIETKDFIVEDVSIQKLNENKNIEHAFIAVEPDNKYSIEFYDFKSEIHASGFYTQKVTEFGSRGVTTELNVSNFSKYTQTTKEEYGVVSRIGNTVLYLNAPVEYKDAINTLLKEIGY